MKLSVYVPDALAARMEGVAMNVSSVCQEAIEAELVRLRRLDQLDRGMERVELRDENHGGADVAFIGRQIADAQQGRHGRQLFAYLTKQHRIAVYDLDGEHLWTFDTFEDLERWAGDVPDEVTQELLAEVAQALEVPRVIELDI